MAATPTNLISYDVFDTVLTRLVGQPASAFLLVGLRAIQQNIWRHSAVIFEQARISAEDRARRNHPGREVTLEQIYLELAHASPEIAVHLDAFQAIEISVERELLVPVPGTLKRIQQERIAGLSHAFISDMYLPADVITEQLHKYGVATTSDPVWVSSTTGKTKGAGTLFDLVRSTLTPASWTHVGDNVWADVDVPRRKNIQGEFFGDCHLTHGELALDRHSHRTGGVGALFSGAARWTRLNSPPPETSTSQTLQRLATEVAGPIIYSYVWWIIQTCQAEGINKIWFMARDGEVMLPVAKEIASKLGIDIDIGYLYAGRQVIKPATLRQYDDDTVDWIMHGAQFLTTREWLTRLNLTFEETRALQPDLPDANAIIGQENLAALRSLMSDKAFQALTISRSTEIRKRVTQYLQHCNLLDSTRCCIVDIGWRGTVLKALDELIGREHTRRHLFLYFGLHGLPAAQGELDARGYLFEHKPQQARGRGADLPCITSIMEIFCQADHGPVLAVESQGNTYVPRCGAHVTSDQWNIEIFQKYIHSFARSVQIDLLHDHAPDLRDLVESTLRRLLIQPTRQESSLIASIPFTNGPEGGGHAGVCRAYCLADLVTAYRVGGWPSIGLNWWIQGAQVITTPTMVLLIRISAKLGRLRAKFVRQKTQDPRR